MQPYDNDDELQREAEFWDEGRRTWTDDDIRAMGYKESKKYPGYFENDPRHPALTVEDRYLIDHPGPYWRNKTSLESEAKTLGTNRIRGLPRYDDEMFEGQSTDDWNPPPRPVPKIIPVTSGEAERILQQRRLPTEDGPESSIEATRRLSGLWVCRICRKNFALWPSERAWRVKPFGVQIVLVFRSPLACTNCRLMEFQALQPLTREDRRPFWTQAIGYWETFRGISGLYAKTKFIMRVVCIVASKRRRIPYGKFAAFVDDWETRQRTNKRRKVPHG